MFAKYDIQELDFLQSENRVHSFSYTELDNEPSLLHSHAMSEIIAPQTDYCRLVVTDFAVPMKRGFLYVVNPHVMHTEIKASAHGAADYYAIKIDSSVLKQHLLQPMFVIDCGKSVNDLNAYLALAKKHFEEEGNARLASLDLQCFFLCFSDILKKSDYTFEKEKAGKISGLISQVKQYLSNNYGSDIKIEELCEKFALSHNSLLTLFRREVGTSPKEYLTEQRLNSAKYLLKSTDYRITQISALCGFTSHAYFSACFKEKFGQTPKEYRISTEGQNDAPSA